MHACMCVRGLGGVGGKRSGTRGDEGRQQSDRRQSDTRGGHTAGRAAPGHLGRRLAGLAGQVVHFLLSLHRDTAPGCCAAAGSRSASRGTLFARGRRRRACCERRSPLRRCLGCGLLLPLRCRLLQQGAMGGRRWLAGWSAGKQAPAAVAATGSRRGLRSLTSFTAAFLALGAVEGAAGFFSDLTSAAAAASNEGRVAGAHGAVWDC